jgi:hypothetical protein
MAENKVERVSEVDQAEVDQGKEDRIVIKTDTYAIDEGALGHNLPKHYYRSIGFIGSVAVSRAA